jgi:hypothetical protein
LRPRLRHHHHRRRRRRRLVAAVAAVAALENELTPIEQTGNRRSYISLRKHSNRGLHFICVSKTTRRHSFN